MSQQPKRTPPDGLPPVDDPSVRGDRLESWKAIAAFLERDVRTVQRWEDRDGLPVHRLPRAGRDAVYAFAAELEAWRNRSRRESISPAAPSPDVDGLPADPAPPTRSVRRPTTLVVGSVGTLLLLVLAMLIARPWTVRGHALAATPPAPLPFGERFFAARTSEGTNSVARVRAPGLGPIAISPDGRTIYGVEPGQLVAFDTAGPRVIRHARIAGAIRGLLLSPDGERLYVDFQDRTTLAVVDVSFERARDVQLGAIASAMLLTPDGSQLYAALPYEGLVRIDTRTLAATRIDLPPCPTALALAPDGRRLFVSFQCGGFGGRSGHDVIALFDPATNALTPFVSNPPFIGGEMVVAPDRSQLWVGSDGACTSAQYDHAGCSPPGSDATYVIDAVRGGVLSVFGTDGGAVDFSPAGDRAVTTYGAVIDVSRTAALETLPYDGQSVASAWSPDGRTLYVSHDGELALYHASSGACSPPVRNLVDWWPGDGAYSDVFGIDHGTPSRGVDFVPGVAGQAFRFHGGDIDVGNANSLDLFSSRDNRYTLAAWVKFDGTSADDQPLMTRISEDDADGWVFQRDGQGHLSFCISGRCVSGRTALVSGAWIHVAAEVMFGHVALFVNARDDGDGEISTVPGAARGVHAYLGADPSHHRQLQGVLDEVMVYAGTLGASDLRQLTQIPECLRRVPS